ncbi:hypothetical protein GCM10019016_132580 [Streptomyces prasinosporus]|uniref:Integral membrane protein n=1 Tax=Streptomyces prasinosporus TaxID=68256 RepID=A0ABP6UHE3_9ACTN
MGTRLRGRPRGRNPLRRRSDVIEAWTVSAVAVLVCVGAPLVGAVVARWAHDEARATAAEQRADRHRVRAEVVGGPAGAPSSSRAGEQRVPRATVRWTEPGGGRRTALARVPAGTRRGDVVHVWFDSRGRDVPPPVDSATVWQHGIGMGVCAAGVSAAGVLLVHRAVRETMLRRRLAEWERAWARTEPEWTRRGA